MYLFPESGVCVASGWRGPIPNSAQITVIELPQSDSVYLGERRTGLRVLFRRINLSLNIRDIVLETVTLIRWGDAFDHPRVKTTRSPWFNTDVHWKWAQRSNFTQYIIPSRVWPAILPSDSESMSIDNRSRCPRCSSGSNCNRQRKDNIGTECARGNLCLPLTTNSAPMLSSQAADMSLQ